MATARRREEERKPRTASTLPVRAHRRHPGAARLLPGQRQTRPRRTRHRGQEGGLCAGGTVHPAPSHQAGSHARRPRRATRWPARVPVPRPAPAPAALRPQRGVGGGSQAGPRPCLGGRTAGQALGDVVLRLPHRNDHGLGRHTALSPPRIHPGGPALVHPERRHPRPCRGPIASASTEARISCPTPSRTLWVRSPSRSTSCRRTPHTSKAASRTSTRLRPACSSPLCPATPRPSA